MEKERVKRGFKGRDTNFRPLVRLHSRNINCYPLSILGVKANRIKICLTEKHFICQDMVCKVQIQEVI